MTQVESKLKTRIQLGHGYIRLYYGSRRRKHGHGHFRGECSGLREQWNLEISTGIMATHGLSMG